MAIASDDAFDGRMVHLAGEPAVGGTPETVRDALEAWAVLLRHAEQSAGEVRASAVRDAHRLRNESMADVERRIEQATKVAHALVQNAEARAADIVDVANSRRVEEEARLAEGQRLARQTIAEAERKAERRTSQAETDAVDVLRRAWDAATTMQQDLLDEADAEVAEMLQRAEADAALLREASDRHFQDAKRLREDAARVRESARRYADDLMIAALHATPEPAASEPSERVRPAWSQTARSILRRISPFVAIVLLILVVQGYVVQPYAVAGTSMVPALSGGDLLLINKISYRLNPPERGDVVVIRNLDGTSDESLVKRVVGMPGESVVSDGLNIEIDGRPIQENYLAGDAWTGSFLSGEIPDDHVFVLGDNRPGSRDSRHFGPVAVADIEGRADVVVWPLNSLRTL